MSDMGAPDVFQWYPVLEKSHRVVARGVTADIAYSQALFPWLIGLGSGLSSKGMEQGEARLFALGHPHRPKTQTHTHAHT
jgi:hypothetical protein